MNVNALQSSGWPSASVGSSGPANSQRNNSSGSSSDAAAAAAVESTQVTLSASASLNFYDIPASLGLQPNTQNNAWSMPLQSTGSGSSASSLLGSFAENELASQLGSPSALAGATVIMNSFSSQSSSTDGYAQVANGQSGQGANSSATALEASSSVTLQGSGDIKLADGELIPFTATLNTSASVVESNPTASSGAASATPDTAATANASPSNSTFPDQSLQLPNAANTQAGSHNSGTGVQSEWSKMMQQYDLLLNLFDTVKAAVDYSKTAPGAALDSTAVGAPVSAPSVSASPVSAASALAPSTPTGAVATAS